MYSFVFKEKLRKLNPKLYVDDKHHVHQTGEHFSSVIRIKGGQREDTKTIGATGLLVDIEAGHVDAPVTGIPYNWIPEYDLFDLESGKLLAKGYRSTLWLLKTKNLIDWSKASRLFGISESFYEHLTAEEKLQFFRKRNGYVDPMEKARSMFRDYLHNA